MAKKKEISENVTKIKKALEDKKLVIGSNRLLKELKVGRVEEIFITTNCPAALKDDLVSYADMNKKKATELDITNEELGVLCKKPFSINVVGISRK